MLTSTTGATNFKDINVSDIRFIFFKKTQKIIPRNFNLNFFLSGTNNRPKDIRFPVRKAVKKRSFSIHRIKHKISAVRSTQQTNKKFI